MERVHPLPSSTCTNFQPLQCITPPPCFPLGVSKPSSTSGPFTLHTHPRKKHDPKSLPNTQRAKSSLLKDPGSASWQINQSSGPKRTGVQGEQQRWRQSSGRGLPAHTSTGLISAPEQEADDGNRSLFTPEGHGGPHAAALWGLQGRAAVLQNQHCPGQGLRWGPPSPVLQPSTRSHQPRDGRRGPCLHPC